MKLQDIDYCEELENFLDELGHGDRFDLLDEFTDDKWDVNIVTGETCREVINEMIEKAMWIGHKVKDEEGPMCLVKHAFGVSIIKGTGEEILKSMKVRLAEWLEIKLHDLLDD